MKHALILALLSALMLWPEYMHAHPTHKAHHLLRRAPLNADTREIPLADGRSISWDPVNVPVEPPLGTCGITSNMSIVSVPGDNQAFFVDTTSIFSWVATKNMKCFDTDQNGTALAGADCIPPTLQADPTGNLDPVAGTPQTQAFGLNGAYSVTGVSMSTNISNFGGFKNVPYTIFAAQELKFPRNSNPVFRSFGRTPLDPVGVLGFGQLKTATVGGWGGYTSNTAIHTSPLMEAISSPGGPIPRWTLAMPRGNEKGVLVIGGWASAVTVPVMKWDLWSVTTIDHPPSEKKLDAGYYIPVTGLDVWQIGEKTSPITNKDTSMGHYLIDSLSVVIRTSNTTAKDVAEMFRPQGWADPITGAWYLECNANMTQNVGLRLQGQTHTRAFLLAQEDMKIVNPDGRCISAFQPPGADGELRLGWPFLKNVVITFDIGNKPTTLNITQRVLPENAGLQLID